MCVHDILNEAARNFADAGIPSPRLDAEILLAFCLSCDRIDFIKNPATPVDAETLAAFRQLAARRLAWEPVAYITGRKEFWSFVLEVNRSVLIPRPDTEVLVEEALNVSRQRNLEEIRILDIGTGSGAVALALASEISTARLTATDISGAALATASRNARNLNLHRQIEFLQGDLFEPVDGFFDIIVANPPYIADEEYEKLPAGVKNYEPAAALLAGVEGLDFYRKIAAAAPGCLKDDAWILLETGSTQSTPIGEIFASSGQYSDISIRNDYAGLPRVIKARRKISG